MKKITSIILAIFLTACGSSSGDSTNMTNTEETSNNISDTTDTEESTTTTTSTFKLEAWADNWFAAYLDETLIVEDSVAITTERSFNKEVATFSGTYPLHINVILKDFKENDTGLEYIGAANQQMGDGGFIAQITDIETQKIIAVTNADWVCQVIHIAPLDKSCANESNPIASVAPCTFTSIAEPTDWKSSSYDDSGWSKASIYSEAEVSPKDGYNEITWDSSAKLIWGDDLETSNTILCRVTIEAPTTTESTSTSTAQIALCDINFIDSANVTSCDESELIVTSNGRVNEGEYHYTMMKGISEGGWNGQYPTAQDYKGSNSFTLPANPTLASEPTIFVRNGVGVTVNGIPIFLPQSPGALGGTSCIVNKADECLRDSIADGEMDECGGHSGKGNDYHYHQFTTNSGCLKDMVSKKFGVNAPLGVLSDGYILYPNIIEGSSQHTYTYADALTDSTNTEIVSFNTNKVKLTDSCGGYITADGQPYYVATNTFPYITNCLIGNFTQGAAAQPSGTGANSTPTSGEITNYYVEEQGDGSLCHYLSFGGGQTTEYCE